MLDNLQVRCGTQKTFDDLTYQLTHYRVYERNDLDMTSIKNRQLELGKMECIVGFIAIVGLGYLLIPFRYELKFWQLVRRHPDLAMKLFAIEAIDITCIIDAEPPTTRYKGPFQVTTCDGVTHEVYIRSNGIRATQARMARSLRGGGPTS
jgi:hypothetical protein